MQNSRMIYQRMTSSRMNPESKSLTESKALKFNTKMYPKHIQEIDSVLEKAPQNRHSTDLNVIIPQLQQLSQLSLEFARNIIKNAKIYPVQSGKIICEANNSVESVFMVLDGKLGIVKQKQQNLQPSQEILTIKDKINTLAKKAYQFVKQNRLILKNTKSMNEKGNAIDRFPKKIKIYDMVIQKIITNQELYGLDDLMQEKEVYINTLATLNDSIIMEISSIRFMEALNEYNQKQMNYVIDKFMKASVAFRKIDIQKLKLIIGKSQVEKRKKGEFFYMENEAADYFYILFEGEARLSKQIQLFVENPNHLYINRSLLLSKGEGKSSLPYANLEEIYNYHPQKKTFYLGILTDICLFGEEQLFQKIPREVNAEVMSIEASAYKISGKMLESIIGDKKPQAFNQFKEILYGTLTKNRILYRQEKLAEMLYLQNKNNMKYFYLEANKEVVRTPKIEQLRKINNCISPKKTSSKKQDKGPKHQPYFSKHNFHKLTTTSTPRNQESVSKNLNDSDIKFTPRQLNIAALTHTTRMISNNVHTLQQMSDKMKLRNYSIDVKNPLIDVTFFNNVKKESLRIQNTYRKKRFSSITRAVSRIHTARPSQQEQ